MAEPRHGLYRYRLGCRCDECRAALTQMHRRWKERKKTDPTAADRAGHGKASTYSNYGCRCESCTRANTERCRSRRAA